MVVAKVADRWRRMCMVTEVAVRMAAVRVWSSESPSKGGSCAVARARGSARLGES